MPTRIRNRCTTDIGENSQPVLDSPENVTTCIHSIYIANKVNEEIKVTLKLYDVSEVVDVCILNEVRIPANTTLNLSSTLILEPGDSISLASDTPASADIFFSVSEISFQNAPNLPM